MSVSDQNKVSEDDSQIIQIEDPSTYDRVGVLPTGELKVAITQPLPGGTGAIGSVNLNDGDGDPITSQLIDTINNYQALHTLTPDRTTTSTALGALNATVAISLEGMNSVGFLLYAGTLTATLTPEQSVDGGTTWIAARFFNPISLVVVSAFAVTNPNNATTLGVITVQGASHVRVRVSAYTSGTANSVLRTSRSAGFQANVPASKSDVDANTTFSFSTDVNMATSGVKNPLVLMRNPAGSGKNFYLKTITAGVQVENNFGLFDVWSTPTVGATGTLGTGYTRSLGSGTTPSAIISTLPTVSSSGNRLSSFVNAANANSVGIIEPYELKMEQGSSLLITGDPKSNNRSAGITIVWSEF